MKSFNDYLAEAEYASHNPVVGDRFDIVIKEITKLQSRVIELAEDGIVIEGDSALLEALQRYNITEGMFVSPDEEEGMKIFPAYINPKPLSDEHSDQSEGKSVKNYGTSIDSPNGEIQDMPHVKKMQKIADKNERAINKKKNESKVYVRHADKIFELNVSGIRKLNTDTRRWSCRVW
jgi:hypothetical protein